MKHFLRVLACGVVLAASGCKSGPQIDEGILTIVEDGSPVGDFVRPDKSLYEKRGLDLDGYTLLSPQDRKTLLIWARANCKAAE